MRQSVLHQLQGLSLRQICEFEARVTNETGLKIKKLRTDGGGEYTSAKFENFLKTERNSAWDHGTEFTSRALDEWAWQNGVQLDFIRPGKPIENALIESFNGRLRDECLNVQEFTTLNDARQQLERWRIDYNEHRPHGSLGNLTPYEFVELNQSTGAHKAQISG